MQLHATDLELLEDVHQTLGRTTTGEAPISTMEDVVEMHDSENVPPELLEAIELAEDGEFSAAKDRVHRVITEVTA